QEMKFEQLRSRAKELSDFLIEHGVKKDDRIAILSESNPEWAIVFFACVRSGAILVPLDPKLTAAELQPISMTRARQSCSLPGSISTERKHCCQKQISFLICMSPMRRRRPAATAADGAP